MTTNTDLKLIVNLPTGHWSGQNYVATSPWSEDDSTIRLHIPVSRDPDHRKRGLKVHCTTEEFTDKEGAVHTVVTVNILELHPVIDVLSDDEEEKRASEWVETNLEINDNGRTYCCSPTERSYSEPDSPVPPLVPTVQYI
jgi:hypothetical protein